MKKVRALETFTMRSGIALEKGHFANVSDVEARQLAQEKKVSIPHLPENRTFK